MVQWYRIITHNTCGPSTIPIHAVNIFQKGQTFLTCLQVNKGSVVHLIIAMYVSVQ
jgi:hypothetical protein